jgi:hypothetical protein
MRQFWQGIAGIGVLLGALLVGACGYGLGTGTVIHGSGTLKTETRPVSHIAAVSISCPGILTITQTGKEALIVTADDNILPLINTDMEGTTLDIHLQTNTSIQPSHPIEFTLSVKDLSAITMTGATTVAVTKLNTTALTVTSSGAGTLTSPDLALTSLTANLTGAGGVQLTGQAQQQTVTITGAGTYHSEHFATQTTSIKLTGAGQAFVRASATLNVTITGAGDVTYYGSPAVTQSITGTGKVQHGGA